MSAAGPEPSAGSGGSPGWFPRLRRQVWLRRFLLGLVSLGRPAPVHLLGVPMSSAETGLLGENLAVKFLRRRGRRVLYRNYRGFHRGEVDIVARHGRTLTFVEVKTRRSAAYGRPADAVTEDKQRLVRRGAEDWLRLLGNPRISIRFDIVEVLLVEGQAPKLHVIENAFTFADASMTGR